MKNLLILLISSYIIFILIYLSSKKKNATARNTLLHRIQKSFKGKTHTNTKTKNSIYDDLMKNPEKNINIGDWDEEIDLREKAELHRTRLKKYGKSKINNEMLFLGPKGGIYKLTENGNKIYI